MKWKYLFGALIVVGGLIVWVLSQRSASGTAAPDIANLSYNICLKAGSGYQILENDTIARVAYASNYWADSTGQYFSKTLVSPLGDTLFVSIFNNASLHRAEETLRSAGFEILAREQAESSGFTCLKALSRSENGAFFLRWLIADPQFQVVAMADLPGSDSAALAQRFHNDPFIQSIKKCL
ncbi:MAG: hypothetical protein KDC66_16305 [Phaeodactylibacter sp.]|nr:hypothetical protein [Phaeodactylibacter sp.]MCB9273516.1 hypothetical protein [Lewinellaceae bacterium]